MTAITGAVFEYTGIREVTVHRDNPCFSASGRFLLDVQGISIIRCLGVAKTLEIPSDIQVL
jgi:hypothetical protein